MFSRAQSSIEKDGKSSLNTLEANNLSHSIMEMERTGEVWALDHSPKETFELATTIPQIIVFVPLYRFNIPQSVGKFQTG
jgi:hypothetical protein